MNSSILVFLNERQKLTMESILEKEISRIMREKSSVSERRYCGVAIKSDHIFIITTHGTIICDLSLYGPARTQKNNEQKNNSKKSNIYVLIDNGAKKILELRLEHLISGGWRNKKLRGKFVGFDIEDDQLQIKTTRDLFCFDIKLKEFHFHKNETRLQREQAEQKK